MRQRAKKTSAKKRLLYYLKNKYTVNLEPGSPVESSRKRKNDESDVNPNR